MNLNDINLFLLKHDYDVRKIGDARWIDQKCTMMFYQLYLTAL